MIDAPERLNIKDFVVIEPKKDLGNPFDPKVDIPQEAWDEMRITLNSGLGVMRVNRGSAHRIVEMAANVKFLAGDDASNHPRLTDAHWRAIEELTDSYRDSKEWDRYLTVLRSVHILDPERAKQEKYQIPQEAALDIINDVSTTRPWVEHLHLYADLKLITRNTHLTQPKYLLAALKPRVDELSGKVKSGTADATEYKEVLEAINSAKIVDANRADEYFSSFSGNWSEMKRLLHGIRNPHLSGLEQILNASHYAKYAADLLIFTAKEIKIEENGLELVIPEPQIPSELDQKIEVPQMRKF